MRLHTTSSRRRGTVTVIVVAFLALLLVLGLSFAFYALRESEESRVYRDSVNGGATGVTPTVRTSSGLDDPPEPDSIANSVLGSVVYGAPDDLGGAFNALRCQELARTVYGWNPKYPSPYYGYNPALPSPPFPAPDATRAATQPFNGFGLVPSSKVGIPGMLPDNVVNWTWVPGMWPNNLMFDPDNNYARDPRSGPLLPWSFNPPSLGGTDRYWAKNADYTYPDLNNFFLAAVDPKTGKVLVPSYHRPWLLTGQVPPNPAPGQQLAIDPTNSWTNPQGRLQMLRPRPVDHQWPPGSGMSEWRYPTMNPDGSYGDVELLTGKSMGQQLDALWIDTDLPVRTWRGKSYKPLVAMLIVDQDGRVNLNTAGNFYPSQTVPGQFEHGSNQGVGPWEVNPSRVLLSYPDPMNPFNPVPNTFDGAQLTLGTQNPTLPATGAHARYGLSWLNTAGGPVPIWAPIKQYGGYAFNGDVSSAASPNQTQQYGQNMPPYGSGGHSYSGIDFDGRKGKGQFAADDAQGHFTSFTWGPPYVGPPNPSYPVNQPDPNSRFGNGYYMSAGAGQPPIYEERIDHPSLFNPYLLRPLAFNDLTISPGRVIPNRTFGVEELRALNGQFNYSISSSSQLARLAQNTLGNPAFRYNTGSPPGSQLNARFATTVLSNDFDLPGAGPSRIQSQPYTPPPAGQPLTQPVSNGSVVDPTNAAAATDEYDDSFRSRLTSLLGPIDLDRKLTDYRYTTAYPLGFDMGMANNPRFNVGDTQRAIADRQQLAADIFSRLCRVTGVAPGGTGVFTPTAGDPNQRWLAQLAVNIVDFIDTDDCITPFHWTAQNGGGALPLANDQVANIQQYATNGTIKTEWVFGFERPRVNINEAYLRIENDPADTFPVDATSGKKSASKDYDMKMWLELHNPLTPASANEQLIGIEGYLSGGDDDTHGGYRAALKDALLGNTGAVYRVLLYKVTGQQRADLPDVLGMRAADNVAGLPTTGLTVQTLNSPTTGQQQVLTFDKGTDGQNIVDDSGNNVGGKTVIQPNVNAAYRGDRSFYLAGPELDQQNGSGAAKIPQPNPDATADLTSKSLQAKVKFDGEFNNVTGVAWSPAFVLQRLACPALPPSTTNPFVTIDYWESDPIAVNNRLKYDKDGNTFNTTTPGEPPDWSSTFAWGRRQPYDGVVKYTAALEKNYKQAPQGGGMGKINYTFAQHNGQTAMSQNQWPQAADQTLGADPNVAPLFTPLAHYDRVVLNPTELFNVVAVKPHELTHEFYGPPGGANPGLTVANKRLKYTADWMDHSANLTSPVPSGTMLYRALGLLRTPTPLEGLGMGGRVPGKINPNTIFTQEVFDAVCDAQQGVTPLGPNRFSQTEVNQAWTALLQARQGGAGAQVQIQMTDRPLVGAATSILRSPTATDPGDWDRLRTVARPDMLWPMTDLKSPKNTEQYTKGAAPGGHAAAVEKYEMLGKVYNQFTTRSNTFAVYMMFGYFEVKNPGPYNESNRPILGKELGTDDGTVTRHKYFAVIDRTNLSIEAFAPAQLVAPGQPTAPIRQGQAPVYFSYQPAVPQPSAANQFKVVADPPTVVTPPATGPITVNVNVPAIGQAVDPATGNPIPGIVMGQYDGTPWTIRPGVSQFVLDVGQRQETATLLAVVYDTMPTNSAVLTLQLSGTIPHDRGAVLRLTNPDPNQLPSTPGNPGPQPGFNYKSPRYAPVVKYVEQLK